MDEHLARGYKAFFHAQQAVEIILLINVKMPTIVGFLTFISMINTASDDFNQETSSFLGILVFFLSNRNFVLS